MTWNIILMYMSKFILVSNKIDENIDFHDIIVNNRNSSIMQVNIETRLV